MGTQVKHLNDQFPGVDIPYFGGCPDCGSEDGMLNVGRAHWSHCKTHLTKWCVGENLFSGWRDESAEVWRQNDQELGRYREVQPVHGVPTPTIALKSRLTKRMALDLACEIIRASSDYGTDEFRFELMEGSDVVEAVPF